MEKDILLFIKNQGLLESYMKADPEIKELILKSINLPLEYKEKVIELLKELAENYDPNEPEPVRLEPGERL